MRFIQKYKFNFSTLFSKNRSDLIVISRIRPAAFMKKIQEWNGYERLPSSQPPTMSSLSAAPPPHLTESICGHSWKAPRLSCLASLAPPNSRTGQPFSLALARPPDHLHLLYIIQKKYYNSILTVLYSTVLYSTVQYYPVLYSTILYCTVAFLTLIRMTKDEKVLAIFKGLLL